MPFLLARKKSLLMVVFAYLCYQQSSVVVVYSLKPVGIAGQSSGNGPNSQACLQRVGELDKCLPKLVVYGDRKFDPPRNDDQLDKHCQSLDDNLKCVSSYSRECLPAFARNLYSIMIRRLKTQFAKRCKSNDGRKGKLSLRV